MIQQLSWSIANLFVKKQEVPEEDAEIYAFGFECILATVIQLMALFISGLIFGCLIELAVYSLCFTQIKKHIGGWHANTHFACISGYTAMALGVVFVCKMAPGWVSFVLLAIALGLICALAPIQHANNPKTDEETAVARKKALLVTGIIIACVAGVFLSPFTYYAIFGACGLFMASMSLTVPNKTDE